MTRREERRLRAETHQLRKQAIAARRQLIAQHWPSATVNEIASMLDMTAEAVCANAAKLGLQRRPFSARP